MWWWNFGIPGFVAFLFIAGGLARNYGRLQDWQDALALCRDLEEERTSLWPWRSKLTARSGPLEVRITKATGTDDKAKVVIEGAEGFSVLKLRRQILKLWTREIEVGDQKFDDEFLLDGPLRAVCARLDGKLRQQLLRVRTVCDPVVIDDGRFRVEVPQDKLPQILPVLLDISRQLALPGDVERRLAENARRDPEPGVRLTNLLLLVRESPGDPDILRLLHAACSDESPRVRVRAAIELGEEGHDVLLKIAQDSTDDAASAQAVSHLGTRLPLRRTSTIVFRSLDKGHAQTVRACLEVLGRRKAEAVDVLEKVMTRAKGELAAAAALALGATGAAAAEPPLLQALQSEDSDLREAAAAALGRVGSVAAVPPLKEAAERSLFDSALRRAARQSVAAIQARLEGASPGQLSLADAEAGQLSLADAEAGQLSLAPHEVTDEAEAGPLSGSRQTERES